VEDDHVRRLHSVQIERDVVQPPLDAPSQSGLVHESLRFLLVRGRELEVDGTRGAALQQFDLDLADAAADFEHRRAGDAALLEKLDHPPRRLVETTLSISPGHSAGEPLREEAVAAARVAAARHGESLASRIDRRP
jgi:hypothetical protein